MNEAVSKIRISHLTSGVSLWRIKPQMSSVTWSLKFDTRLDAVFRTVCFNRVKQASSELRCQTSHLLVCCIYCRNMILHAALLKMLYYTDALLPQTTMQVIVCCFYILFTQIFFIYISISQKPVKLMQKSMYSIFS